MLVRGFCVIAIDAKHQDVFVDFVLADDQDGAAQIVDHLNSAIVDSIRRMVFEVNDGCYYTVTAEAVLERTEPLRREVSATRTIIITSNDSPN